MLTIYSYNCSYNNSKIINITSCQISGLESHIKEVQQKFKHFVQAYYSYFFTLYSYSCSKTCKKANGINQFIAVYIVHVWCVCKKIYNKVLVYTGLLYSIFHQLNEIQTWCGVTISVIFAIKLPRQEVCQYHKQWIY